VVTFQPVRIFRVQRPGAALRFLNVALAFMSAIVQRPTTRVSREPLDETESPHPACPELCEGSEARDLLFLT
jgi:hypothetical protein